MSEYLKPAVITASVPIEHGCTMLADTLERLIEEYEFGFRDNGGISCLEYVNGKFLDEVILERSPSIATIDREHIKRLGADHTAIAITGSFRWPGQHRLLDVSVALCRTFQSERPVCLVVHMDAYLYNTLRDADLRVNHEAADRFQTLAITFGAHELTDGFVTPNIVSFDQVRGFDGEALRKSYVEPLSVMERWAQRGKATLLMRGPVSGIKSSFLTREELDAEGEGEVFETVTGVVILSMVHVEIDLDDDDG